MGEEASKSYKLRLENGFIDTYLSGEAILDVGYKGYIADVVPIVPQAIGVELDFPGYDGRTLPFAEESQDAVFASHCLEHIPDFRNALQDWFRVLRVGGFLVIMVPHQFLYEKKVALPSQFNGDHQRFYTPASLMAEIEESLPPNSYRLRHLADNDLGYDYSIPPQHHSGGCYELELVVEKIEAPDWPLALRTVRRFATDDEAGGDFDAIGTGTTQDVVAEREAGTQRITTLAAKPHDIALYDFGREAGGVRRVLAMTLGHFGDFIIGLPALRRLRAAFPEAHIRLVVGAWNQVAAETCGLVDEVATYNYFPENARNWDGRPVHGMDRFHAAAAGVFDVAIDLRVDEDTRHLLKEVDAVVRCGIGVSARFPFLDVVLPFDHSLRLTDGLDRVSNVLLGPERFDSRMPRRTPFRHDTDFSVGDTHVIYGPYIRLPPGRFRVTFGLQLSGLRFGLKRTRITVDVAHNGSNIVATREFTADRIAPAINDGVQVDFVNNYEDGTFEFRVHTSGRPLRAMMGFSGVRLDQLEAPAAARFRRSDLHIGEQLSLLVQLLADRANQLYPVRVAGLPEERAIVADGAGALSPEVAEMLELLPRGRHRVVVAPVSNSDLRDWPVAHYVSLIRALVERLDCVVLLVGSRMQARPLDRIVEESGCAGRIISLAGRTAWSDMPAVLRGADLVICNNSGIGHLAASMGAPTLAIYSASHQPQEWGPRGPRSQALMAVVPCSPCGYDRLSDCPYEHACMQGLLPESVFAQAARRLAT